MPLVTADVKMSENARNELTHRTVVVQGLVLSTTVADETGGVCSGIAGPWLGAAVSTKTRTG